MRGRELRAQSEGDNETKDETKVKSAGLTWQRAALNELYANLDDTERLQYEQAAQDHNAAVDSGPAADDVYM